MKRNERNRPPRTSDTVPLCRQLAAVTAVGKQSGRRYGPPPGWVRRASPAAVLGFDPTVPGRLGGRALPMSDQRRRAAYRSTFTERQWRRLRHKANAELHRAELAHALVGGA